MLHAESLQVLASSIDVLSLYPICDFVNQVHTGLRCHKSNAAAGWDGRCKDLDVPSKVPLRQLGAPFWTWLYVVYKKRVHDLQYGKPLCLAAGGE